MTDIFVYSFNAVAPIIGLILVGYVARRAGLLDAHTLKVINRFNFRVCFFAMMFVNLYQMEGFGALSGALAGTAMGGLLLVTLLDFFLSRLVTPDRIGGARCFSAVFAPTTRSSVWCWRRPWPDNRGESWPPCFSCLR